MIRTFISALLVFCCLGAPSALYADECKKATPVSINNKSPCSGIIVPLGWAVQAAECISIRVPTLDAEKEHLVNRINACQKHKSELGLLCDAQIKKLIKTMDENAGLVERQWWESPYTWGVGGFVLGSVVMYSVIYSVSGN